MDRKQGIKIFLWILNLLVIFLLIWSLVNYQILNQEVGEIVKVWGIVAMIFFVIVLEGAPVFVGSSIAVASILAMGIFNPWLILFLFLFSAVIGNIFYFYLGHFSGKTILNYFDKRDVKRYKMLFRKYGKAAMFIMAVSPIPYFPTLIGVFKIKSPYLVSEILIVRLIRHTIVFLVWFWILIKF